MRIFVYGSLMRNQRANHLLKNAKFVGEMKTTPRHQLYQISWFPGMVESPDKTGTGVNGEVFEISEDALPGLDNYECVTGGLFRREEIDLEDGSKASTYLFNKSVEQATLIPSGSWHSK